MLKKISLFIFLLLCSGKFYSQSRVIDSLEILIKTNPAEIDLMKIYNQIAISFLEISEYDKVLSFAEKALAIADKLNIPKEKAKAISSIGRVYYKRFKYEEAFQQYNEVLKISKSIQDSFMIGKSYTDIAGTFYMPGNYIEALNYCLKGLRYMEAIKDTKMMAYIIVRIGLIHYYLEDYDSALKDFQKSYVLSQQAGDHYNEAFSFKNIGVIFYKQGESLLQARDTTAALVKYQASLDNYLKSYQLQFESKDESGLLEVYHPLGNTYERLGRLAIERKNYFEGMRLLELAMVNFQSFLHQATNISDKNYMSEALSAMGHLNLYLKKYDKALSQFKQGLKLSNQINMTSNKQVGYCHLAEYFEIIKDYPATLVYLKLCEQYKDSVINLEIERKALRLKSNYEIEKKEKEIKLLTSENQIKTLLAERERQQRNLAWAVFLLFGIVAISGFYFYYLRKQKQNLLAMNSERERISAELHDELGSTLSGISMYSHLMKSQIQKHHFQNLLQSVEIVQKSSQEMIDKIYEIIWMLNPQENSIQHVANQLRQFGSKMATVGNFFFEMNDSVKNTLKVSPEVLKNVYLIFKEAINNAVKYSHASQLVLKIGQANENELTMVLEDNGVGFDQGTVRQGNGLKNMQDRAKKINAKIVLDSKKDIGTKVVLTLNMKM